jgi:hypothetical protein
MGKKMTHIVKIPIKKIPKDLDIAIKEVIEYIDIIANNTKIQIEYESINPVLKISFVLPFKEETQKNDLIIWINQKLKKIIKN